MKKPTIDQRLAAVETALNVFTSEMRNVPSQLRHAINRLEEMKAVDPVDQQQLNQLYAAVNKIAAYAAAMDETKKTMIRLTSRRIDKLEQRLQKLRVRISRLED